MHQISKLNIPLTLIILNKVLIINMNNSNPLQVIRTWLLIQRMHKKPEIHISVTPQYLNDQSIPDENQFVFAYTVLMENRGNTAAKLLTRHWIITDSEGKTEEVRGPGVVGEHPHLKPGESFKYTSGAILQTPVGSMMGSYQMQDENGVLFDASIPAFTLSAEVLFH